MNVQVRILIRPSMRVATALARGIPPSPHARDPRRVIEVEWGSRRDQAYEVDVLVKGYDRKWLHKDITNVIAASNAHLLAVNTRVDAVSGLATMNFALRVADFGQLSTLLGRLAAVPNVIEARRQA